MNRKLIGYRKMLGLSQSEIAEEIGICLTSYCFKERGKNDFTQSEMEKITNLMRQAIPDVTMDEIFFRGKVIDVKLKGRLYSAT